MKLDEKSRIRRSTRRWQVGTLAVSLLLVFIFIALYRSHALLRAVTDNDIDKVKVLIEKGYDVNIEDWDGVTPLQDAALKGNHRIVEILAANGADVNKRDNLNATPLFYAAAKGYTAVAKILIENGAHVNLLCGGGEDTSAMPLHMAAGSGSVQMVEMLIGEGANINGRAQNGWTPLFTAVARGHTRIVKALLARGADANAKDRNGMSALNVATIMGHSDTVKLLRDNGAGVKLTEDIEFETHRDDSFSIIYPRNWNVLSKREIDAISDSMEGDPPVFSVQSPIGSSLSIIMTEARKEIVDTYEKQPRDALERQYAIFVGETLPADFVRLSKMFIIIKGQTAFETVFQMPSMRGTVFIQKHVCLARGNKAFLISATSTSNNFPDDEQDYFENMIQSFSTS